MLKPGSGRKLTLSALLLGLAACGGGSGDGGGPPDPPQNTPPVAHAGNAQTVHAHVPVVLTGTASSDADGSVASWAWTQIDGPAVTLSGAASATPSFVAPQVTTAGSLTFRLVVRDNQGAQSLPATVLVTVQPNARPVAVATAPATAIPGNVISLEGAASSDGDDGISAYLWTQTGGPAVTLIGATSSQASFVVPQNLLGASLTFSLVVRDQRGASSAPVSVTVNVTANTAPTAHAGSSRTVNSGTQVTLDGSASSDPEGAQLSYSWSQVAGPTVMLNAGVAAKPTFTAPVVMAPAVLTFRLVVTDHLGLASAPATVDVTVNPPGSPVPTVAVTGTVRFARVLFSSLQPRGLNYASPVMNPARGVMIRALRADNQDELATGTTDGAGAYSLTVPANISITIEVIARMQRDFTQPLPRWDVRVQDGTAGTPYRYASAAFNSSQGAQDIAIPTGISPGGTTSGPRASGPFAILDTIYTGLTAVAATGIGVEALNSTLVVDWGSQKVGTFFTPEAVPRIALLSDLTEDTDEFDQHVIAHELGHYLEYAYSRADSIGGSHGLGDRLDARVAFGEGFGYAFAAIVLNDPDARDSFVSSGTHVSAGFNVETNPPAQPQAGAGCWCSETSVWSILWDLYDATNEGLDQVTLGFTPIWQVITGPQKRTQSLTTIYSFIAALKSANPAEAAQIDALVAAQNITAAGLDAFATSEVLAPFPNILPLFVPIVVDGPAVVVRNIDDGGRHNKAGNRRYLRFTAPATGLVRVTVSTSNPDPQADPDFLVYRGSPDGIAAGGLLGGSTAPPPQTAETVLVPVSAGNVYIIDAYDCANGCDSPQGTPGDYDLTVTVATAS